MTEIIIAFWIFYIGFEAIKTAEHNYRLRTSFVRESLLLNFIIRTIVFCITIFSHYKTTELPHIVILIQAFITPFLYEGQYASKMNDLDKTAHKRRSLSNLDPDEAIFRMPYQARLIMVSIAMLTYVFYLWLLSSN